MPTLRRAFAVAVVLLLMGPVAALGQLPTNELEGTWKMISQEVIYPDSIHDRSDEWGANFKILNSTHFAWGRETKDGKKVLAGGGRYEYYPKKDLYIEHVQYHSDPGFAGVTLKFEARVEGNTWFLTGDLGDSKLKEVWRRVDSEKVHDELYGADTTSAAASSGTSESGSEEP